MFKIDPVPRRPSRRIMVGDVPVGDGAPISVQSMTNTETCDVPATLAQVQRLADAGADIVRISVPSLEASRAFGEIRAQSPVPLVADIHFDYRIALDVLERGVDCLRINPGNIGREERVRAVVDAARERGVPLRIGVNAGSLEKELQRKYGEPNADALVESALRHVAILERLDFPDFKISVKASEVFMAMEAYRKLAEKVEQPLHLGITEAGGLRSGMVKSAAGLAPLLMEGIGDTLRISLAAEPEEEVRTGWDLLKALHLRSRGVHFIACPGCSRQNFDVIDMVNTLEERLADIRTPVEVAVIGCYVNGPGESRAAEIGVTGSSPRSLVYLDGKPLRKMESGELLQQLEALIRRRAEEKSAALIASG